MVNFAVFVQIFPPVLTRKKKYIMIEKKEVSGMKKLMKFLKNPMFCAVNAMAMVAVIQSLGSACTWYVYQPKMPDSVKKLRKEA